MKANASFLNFEVTHDTGKTKIWSVHTKSGYCLAVISWHSPWRRYVFRATADAIWDASCLREIIEFIDRQMALRKEAKP